MILESIALRIAAFGKSIAGVDMKPSQVQFAIDGLTYTSTKMPASTGLEIWPRLIALVGSTQLKRIATSDGLDIGATLVSFSQQAMNDGLLPLCLDLLGNVQCGALRLPGAANQSGPVAPHFDQHFSGEYEHLLKVCAFAVVHNLRGPTLGSP